MSDQEDRERWRYLQLKQKASLGSETPPQTKEPNLAQEALSIDPNAAIGQQAAQAASAPFRGYRGAAVGVENLVAGKGPQKALERASEAVRPGFKPEGFPETLASAIGESGPLMPLGGIFSAGAKGAALSGIAGAGTTALMEKSENGAVSPASVAFSGSLSTLIPAVPLLIKNVYPQLAAKLTSTSSEAFERQMDDPNFMKNYTGSVEAIRKRATYLINGFQEVENKLKKAFNNFAEFYQLNPTDKEALEVLTETGGEPRSIRTIVSEFKKLKTQREPVLKETVESALLDASGKPIMQVIEKPGLSQNERLLKLLDLDRDLNSFKEGSFDKYTKNLKEQIRTSIKEIPGGARLQKIRSMWSDFSTIRDNLGKDLTDPQKSGVVLEKLVRGDIKGALSGEFEKVKYVIAELEKHGGLRPILKPLRDEILSGMLKKPLTYIPRGAFGGILLAVKPSLAAAETIAGSPRLAASMIKPIQVMAKHSGKAATLASGLLKGAVQ